MRIKVDCIQNYRLLVDRQLRQSRGRGQKKANHPSSQTRESSLLLRDFTTILRFYFSVSKCLPNPFLLLLFLPFLLLLTFYSTCCYCCSLFYFFRPSALSLFTLVAIFCGFIQLLVLFFSFFVFCHFAFSFSLSLLWSTLRGSRSGGDSVECRTERSMRCLLSSCPIELRVQCKYFNYSCCYFMGSLH